ncbi:MAG: DUF1156 domain-containing protein, partial [Clostridia bacterium]|nr:DUF1156 domain-containing protein [Clostridia bacterium]
MNAQTKTQQEIVPFKLKDAPALIERLLPVQKLSAEVYKERMAGSGQTLTALGSYWKGRKPLILAKACVLGCLLPATDNPQKDLEIFEMLMGMDDASLAARMKHKVTPKEILSKVALANIRDYFIVEPDILPKSSPIDLHKPEFARLKVEWRNDVPMRDKRRVISELLPKTSYRNRIDTLYRPEEVPDVHDHIWDAVNAHLGTNAHSFPQLVEQLGIMRFGERPKVADTFCGSGQIPFEAARLGCDVYASDLNPIACMLTWGAFHIVGGSPEEREELKRAQEELVAKVQEEIDNLGIETDGKGWRAKAFLYCVEARCPQTGWMVPLLPTLVISKINRVIAKLIPEPAHKRYRIDIISGVSQKELEEAEKGTVRTDGRGQDPYMVHTVDGKEYRTKISTLRGDYRKPDGTTGNRLRLWEKHDFKPRPDDIFQERLYCIQWMRKVNGKNRFEYEFRAVTEDDLQRERIVEEYVAQHLAEWQEKGWVPDMQIEPGDESERLYRERGWTHWHHLFNPRQLMIWALIKKEINKFEKNISINLQILFLRSIDYNSKLTTWAPTHDTVNNTFANQALNTIFNPPCRSLFYSLNPFFVNIKTNNIKTKKEINSIDVNEINIFTHLFITDPPYGDAIKYE